MCGRYTFTMPVDRVAEYYDVDDPPPVPTRYNIAPSQLVPTIALKADGTGRSLAMLRWGLVPRWATDPNSGPRPINLRSETVSQKFASQFKHRRCLMPADGFYEWKTVGRKKLPYRFTVGDGEPFAFAALWDEWSGGSETIATCCLLTTSANELVRGVHDRMPVILDREAFAEWLDPATPAERLKPMLAPYPADQMRSAEANPAVNSPMTDGPELLTGVETSSQNTLFANLQPNDTP